MQHSAERSVDRTRQFRLEFLKDARLEDATDRACAAVFRGLSAGWRGSH